MNKKNLLPPLQYITKKLVASSNRHSPAGNHMLSRSSFINLHNSWYWLIPAPVRLIASRLRTFLMLRSSIITILCGGGWITDAPVTGVAPSPFNHPCFPTDVRFGERYGLPSLLSLLRRNYPIQQTHSHLNQEIPFLPKLLVPKPHFSKPHPLLSNKQVAALQVREGLTPSGDRLRETISVHTGELGNFRSTSAGDESFLPDRRGQGVDRATRQAGSPSNRKGGILAKVRTGPRKEGSDLAGQAAKSRAFGILSFRRNFHVQELLLSLIEVPSLTPRQATASIPPLHRGGKPSTLASPPSFSQESSQAFPNPV
uniref:Uncharacterized protein n=1 Tax=Fagus sylvatica TaxID=28930 RepID=A0A2N9JAC6_FAGSY